MDNDKRSEIMNEEAKVASSGVGDGSKEFVEKSKLKKSFKINIFPTISNVISKSWSLMPFVIGIILVFYFSAKWTNLTTTVKTQSIEIAELKAFLSSSSLQDGVSRTYYKVLNCIIQHAPEMDGSLSIKIAHAITEASILHRRNFITPELILGIIQQESGFNPDAVSSVGAIGLMQIMPTDTGIPYYTIIYGKQPEDIREELTDPVKNIRIGAYCLADRMEYMRQYHGHKRFRQMALSAYYMGEGALYRYIAKNKDKDNPISGIGYHKAIFQHEKKWKILLTGTASYGK